MLSGCIGFAAFSFSSSLPLGGLALFLGGYGIGQIITATNILAGQRFSEHRGSALSRLNFSFSFGAVLSALLAARLLRYFALPALLQAFAGCFALGALWLVIELLVDPKLPSSAAPSSPPAAQPASGTVTLARNIFLYFCLLLILYGGLETCLGGWLTTFALRYSGSSATFSQYATAILWLSLTAGRILSSLLLLRFAERRVQQVALAFTFALLIALTAAHTAPAIALLSSLLGLSLAPFFPTTFSLLMSTRPKTAQAGWIIAVSGLGAAALPSMMGVLSTQTHSLRAALTLPALAAASLLFLSLFPPSPKPLQTLPTPAPGV